MLIVLFAAQLQNPLRYLQKFKKLILQLALTEVSGWFQLLQVRTQSIDGLLGLKEVLIFAFFKYIKVMDWWTEGGEKKKHLCESLPFKRQATTNPSLG